MPDDQARADARMLRYFWEEKGDVERYYRAKEALAANPGVAKALEKLKKAKARMDRAIAAINEGDDD